MPALLNSALFHCLANSTTLFIYMGTCRKFAHAEIWLKLTEAGEKFVFQYFLASLKIKRGKARRVRNIAAVYLIKLAVACSMLTSAEAFAGLPCFKSQISVYSI